MQAIYFECSTCIYLASTLYLSQGPFSLPSLPGKCTAFLCEYNKSAGGARSSGRRDPRGGPSDRRRHAPYLRT
eukprot:553048-Prorocentrum_minimum.AAC.2